MTVEEAKEAVLAYAQSERVIILSKQEDGNWKGWMKKGGKLVEERQISPEYTLQALLTNSA